MAYKACKTLITAGRTAGLADRIDLFYAFDRITSEQYTELVSLLSGDAE